MKKNTSVQVFILLCSFSVLAFSIYKYVHPSLQYPQSELLHAASLPAVSRTGNIQEGKFSEALPFYTQGNETKVLATPGLQSKASPTTLDTKQHLSETHGQTVAKNGGRYPLKPSHDTSSHDKYQPELRHDSWVQHKISSNLLHSKVDHNKYPRYNTRDEKKLSSKLFYDIQTRALGDPAVCQCDVAVLSYKQNCTDSSLPHVRYIFNQSTTWTTGRNMLFYTFIHNTSDAYLYYIMIDDDMEVRWLKAGNKGDPWREVEGLIAHVQPAVAGLPMSFSEYSQYAQREKRNCSLGEGYATTAWFDGCFTAFHYQAIEHLLPYWSAMDNISWWASHEHLMVRSDVLFSGQVVISKRVMILNSKHREYPRHVIFKDSSQGLKNAFAKSLPEKCPDAPVVEGWREHRKLYSTHLSPTLCLPPPPPKQTITPYTETLFVTEF